MKTKQTRLTKTNVQALTRLLPTLKRLGFRVPRALQGRLNGHPSKLSRKQVTCIERGLGKHGRVVVNTLGRDKGFRVTSLRDFLDKQQQVKIFHAKQPRAAAQVS